MGPDQGLLANDDWGLSVTGWSLDLKDHCIVFPKPAGDDGQTAAAVQQLVDEGMGSDGLWTGTTGLYSSTAAAADAVPGGPRMGILYADAADLGLSPGDTYNGVTIPAYGAIIARYTYVTDSDLDGQIDHGEQGDASLPALPAPSAVSPLTVSATTVETAHATVIVEEDGGFRYLPNDDNFTGADSFSYTVTNQATGATSTADVTVQVQDVPPVVGITGLPGGEAPAGVPIALGSAVTGPGSGGAFIYSWDVTKLAAGTTTEHFATGTAADFTFTPNEEGTYTVQLVVTDAAGGTGQAQAVIEDSQIQTLYWDADGNNSQNTGGTGTWDTTSSCWRVGSSTGTLGTWSNGSHAVFAGNSGTVTVSGNIVASSIEFDTDGYDIQAQAGGTLSGSGAMTITTSGAATAAKIDAAVSASSGMTALGSGTLTLTNSGNSFSETYINAGTLAFNSGALGSGGISFGGGTLEWASGNNQDISSQISIPSGQTANLDTDHSITLASLSGGSGGLNKLDSGTLTITGSASYSGGTTVSAGTLCLGNGTSGGSVSGNININAANAVLEFATPSSGQTYGGIISGSGSVTKSGAGILTLTGTNTFSGAVTISSGALLLGSGSGSVERRHR